MSMLDMELDEAVAYEKARSAFENARRGRTRVRKVRDAKGLPPNNRLENGYCIARHKMMVALRKLEWREEVAASTAIRLANYMNIARLPPELNFNDVLYYTANGVVHIFYGGQESPLGVGNSPDGAKHGHATLRPLRDGLGGYRLSYRREPK